MNRPEHFWHGTHVALNPGDVILPRGKSGADSNYGDGQYAPEGYNAPDFAYASDRLFSAVNYGQHASFWKNRDNKYSVPPGPEVKTRVYRVKPVADDVTVDEFGGNEPGQKKFKDYKSPSGFVVDREVTHSGVCRDCNDLRDLDGGCSCNGQQD